MRNDTHLPPITELSAIFYDCDGVLTDNRVLVTEKGEEAVFFNRSDGLAISAFRNKYHINQVIISTETNNVVEQRAQKLRIPAIHGLDELSGSVRDKGTILKQYAKENLIDLSNSIFIGNDLNDIPALDLVGYPDCPADAYPVILDLIREKIKETGQGWIASSPGGFGVVRELLTYYNK